MSKKKPKSVNLDSYYYLYEDFGYSNDDFEYEYDCITYPKPIVYNKKTTYIPKKELVNRLIAIGLIISSTLVISAWASNDYLNNRTENKIQKQLGDYETGFSYHEQDWGYVFPKDIIIKIISSNNNPYLVLARLYDKLQGVYHMGYKIFDEEYNLYTPEKYLQNIYLLVNDQQNFSEYSNIESYLKDINLSNNVYETLQKDYNQYFNKAKEEEKNNILKKIRIKGE